MSKTQSSLMRKKKRRTKMKTERTVTKAKQVTTKRRRRVKSLRLLRRNPHLLITCGMILDLSHHLASKLADLSMTAKEDSKKVKT